MCRLARPAGNHDLPTRPLIIIRERYENVKKGIKPIVIGSILSEHVCKMLDMGYHIDNGDKISSSYDRSNCMGIESTSN